MKNRLQTLWDEAMPHGGPCPQPDAEAVRRRVDAALYGKSRTVSRRTLRLIVVAATTVLLLAGTALAGKELIPPEFNVLNVNFSWGENTADAIAMMSITPVSVEDDNYVMTVTSSLADGNKLYFTLVAEPKNNEARERLLDNRVIDLLRWRILGSSGGAMSSYYDEEADARLFDVSVDWWPAKGAAVRLDLMDGDVWLRFPVKPVRSVTLKLDAEAQGAGALFLASDAPVTVDRVEISPLSYMLRYTAPNLYLYPVVYFLFRDGSIRTPSQLNVFPHASGGSNTGLFGEHPGRLKYTWQFRSVQNLSEIEAVVLGGTAYPLDGGQPYEVDVSGIPLPFVIPKGEEFFRKGTEIRDEYVPLFALCDGLGADCQWDEAAGVATAAFRDVTLTFTVGSETVQVDGPSSLDPSEESVPPVYWDGELWVDGWRLFLDVWDVQLDQAFWSPQKLEDGSSASGFWAVTP